MAKEKYEAVTFLNADGEEISNDPRWLAERTLREAGVEVPEVDNSEELRQELAAKDQELEALRAALAAKEAEEALEDDEKSEGDYSELKGKDLVDVAKTRGIELTVDGKKLTAPQVREALAAQDKAQA